MKNEADVKNEVKKILRRFNCWWFMPVPTGYGMRGVPDFIICLHGRFVAIETKYGRNRPTKLQQRQLKGIDKADGITFVVDQTNVKYLESWLAEIICDD